MTRLTFVRTLRRRLAALPLRRRLQVAILVPMVIGAVILVWVGRNQVRDSELRLVGSQHREIAEGVTSRITTLLQTLPDSTLTLSNSASLTALLETDYRLDNPTLALLQRSQLLQQRAEALSNLTGEFFELVRRSGDFQAITLVGADGVELVRVEHNRSGSMPRIALPNELQNVAEQDFYQETMALARDRVYISPLLLLSEGEGPEAAYIPIVRFATPVFHRGERAGLVVIDALGESFLQYVSGEAARRSLSAGQALVLADSQGNYLADTREEDLPSESGYHGHLFGLARGTGESVPQREAYLAEALAGDVVGSPLGRLVVTSLRFNPFQTPVAGTPWTLLVLEESGYALANVERFSLLFAAISLGIVAVMAVIVGTISDVLIRPLDEAAAIADRISGGDLDARIPIHNQDEIGRLAHAVNTMTSRLVANIASLEERFRERTRDLEVASEIASVAVGMRDVQVLLNRTVDLIRDRFDFYHVQVFLVDAVTQQARLVASTGEAGQKLLSLNWSLAVGSDSVIGRVTERGENVIALDTEDAAVPHRPNPHLPRTRSEMALPMKIGDRVIGALDIQSVEPNAFSESDVRIFGVLANQLAIAVNNARLLTETERQMQRVEELNRRLTRQAWDTFLARQQDAPQATYGPPGDGGDSTSQVSVPLQVRGETVGMLSAALPPDSHVGEEEMALIEAVVERVSLAVENARLFTETELSLAETERLYQASQAISGSTDSADILRALYEHFGLPGREISLVLWEGERPSEQGAPAQVRHVIREAQSGDYIEEVAQGPVAAGLAQYLAESEGGVRILPTPEAIREGCSPVLAEQLAARGVQALADFPLVAEGVRLGRLMVAHSGPYAFSEREQEIFEALAAQAATVLRSRQLFETVESERQTLNSILGTMPTAVLVIDAHTRQAILANEQAVALLGEDVDLQRLAEEGRLRRADSEEPYPLQETPAFVALESGERAFSEDLVIVQADGTPVDVLSNAAPIRDAQGEISAAVAVFQDITELRELQSALQQTLRETTMIYEASRAIFAEQTIPAIASTVVTHAALNTAPATAHVLLANPAGDKEEAVTVLAAWPEGQPPGNPYPRKILTPDRVTLIGSLRRSSRLDEADLEALRERGIEALAVAPLRVAGETIGWLALGFGEPHTPPPDQQRFLESLADQAAVSLQNARLKEQTEDALSQTMMLYSASREITRASTPEQILDIFASFALPPEASQAAVLLLPEDGSGAGEAQIIARWSRQGQASPALEALLTGGWERLLPPEAFQEDLPVIIEDAQAALAGGAEGEDGLPATMALLPMIVGERLLGFIQVGYGQPYQHSERLVRTYQSLSGQVAAAVDNRRLLQRTQESLEETRVLYETSSALADVTTAQGILEAIVQHATPPATSTAQLLILHGAAWDTPGAMIEIAAAWSREARPDLTGIRFAAEQYPGWAQLSTETLLAIDDVAHDPRLSEEARRSFLGMAVGALVVVPLEIGGTTRAALLLGSGEARQHAEQELRIYQNVAELATIALQNVRLLTQTQRRARQLQTSAEVSRAVISILDMQQLLPRVVDLIRDNFGYDHVQIFLLDEERRSAVLKASTGEVGRTMLEQKWALEVGSDSVIGQVTAQAEAVIALDTADAKVVHRPNPYLPDTRSEMAVPLVARENVLGALDVQSVHARAFDEEDVQVLTALADQIAVALDNARLFQEAQDAALALAQQVHNLESLLEASRVLTTMLSPTDILDAAAQYIVRLLHADHCGIVIAAEADDTVGQVCAEYPITGAKGVVVDLANAWWRAEYERTGMPVVVPDVASTDLMDEATRTLLLEHNIRQVVLVPFLTAGETLIGSIGLDLYEGGREFTSEELTLLQLLTTQVATAYQNAQLFEGQQAAARALEEQVRRLESLYATSLSLTESLDASEILSIALSSLVQTLGIDHGAALLADPEDPAMATVVARHGSDEPRNVRVPFAANPYYATLQATGQPLIVEDVETSPLVAPIREVLVSRGFQTIIIAPLIFKGQVIGVFSLDMHDRRRFSPAEITLVQTITTQTSLAYQNARLFAQAQRQAEEMRFLFQATAEATAHTTIERSLQGVAELIVAQTESEAVAAYLLDEQGDCLRQVAASAVVACAPPERIPLSAGVARAAQETRQPVVVGDMQADGQGDILMEDMRSLLAVPLLAGRELVGLLALFRRGANAYDEGHVRLAQTLSGSLSAVVQNIRLLQEVQAMNERLREVDQLKSQFLANMSHELRTPLNSIIGFSRVILKGIDGPLTEMQKQDLETIHSSGQHLLNLINEILDQSKIEAGKMELATAWFDLTSVIEVARSMSVGLLKDKPVRLNIEVEAELPKVWGDEIRTRQVLLNLLSNAAKFTHEGSITVAAFTVEGEDGPYVQVSVADTGIGIPENKLEAIFLAFEQVDGSLTRTSSGTGLGLPIARSLIELQGGQLWVESTLNVGSTFSFTVPAFAKQSRQEAAEASAEPEADIERKAPPGARRASPRKVVLVIDDEIGMHQLYRRYLNKEGYTVEATSDPTRTEDLIRLARPDLIILDVRMPNRDGWEVLAHLKENDATYRIPVIVCSIDPDTERGFRLGAAEYLVKPFLEEDLLAAIRRVESEQKRDTILIIDDRPETVRLIAEWLRQTQRYEVWTASSGQAALDLIARRSPDLVLLDLNLPDLDGFEVLARLRADPATQNLPVLIITAEDELALLAQERLPGTPIYSKSELDDEGRLLTSVQAAIVSHRAKANGDNAA